MGGSRIGVRGSRIGVRRVENRGSRGLPTGPVGPLESAENRPSPAPARAGVQKVPRFWQDEKSDFFHFRGESRETGRRGDFLEKKRFSPSPYILRKQRFKAVKRAPKKSKKTPRARSSRAGKKVPDREKQPLFLGYTPSVALAVSPRKSCFWLSSEKWTIPAEEGPKKGHPGR